MTPQQTKELGKKLKELRVKKGLSAAQVAEKMGVGYKAPRIYNIESGLKPVGFKMAESYAAACDYSLQINFVEKN